ncbi:Hypothetical predicted protein [Pelobates cultripes]|uniref:Uncharacterized protein n=1 Tax=Pelobates cultripes TaxID=61616 RepID=A0AAD1RK46_PELCU|nr:Hypothetical predicted protein [Pelobates cultripes]
MAPTPTPGPEITALDRIERKLRDLTATMVTRTDLQTLTATIQDTLRSEVAGIRTEIAAQAGRITAAEEAAAALTARMASTDTAVARQGDMLLSIRRHLEDVDNRGRRCNIRVRGVPEAEGTENAEEVLKELFQSLLQSPQPRQIELERAHRALRPRAVEDGPRDLTCCLHSFPVKNAIMTKAREQPTWPFRGAQVSLYNDLSPITIEARRALRPVTALLREHHITYKWGFPFALVARHHNNWFTLRWPEEVPRFMGDLGLPSPTVTNWILGPLGQPPRPQRGTRRQHARSPPARHSGRREDPASPEE